MATYSINLDDVDLALLPLRRSYNNFLKKEYCQFEVMKTVTFEVPEPSLLYTCHICAIDMPAEFASEHATSIKHRANTRIVSIAAQRMCGLITALPPPSAQPTARYCANCATIADDDHYNTRQHQDAVAHDNLLLDLVKAYAKDDDTEYELSNSQINQNKDIDENMYSKKDDVEFNKGNSNNKYNNVANPLDNDQLTKSKDGDKQPTQEEHIAKNSQMNNNTEQNKEYHEFPDDINGNINTSGNNTEVNDVVTVKTDMLVEYPYELASTGQMQCVVCKCQVPRGIRPRKEHIKGLRHRRKVLAQNQQREHIEKGDTKEEIEESCDGCDANDKLEEYSKHEELVDFITDNNASTEISRSNDTAVTMNPSDFQVDTQIADPYTIKDTGHIWCNVCNFRNRIKRESRHEKKEEKAVEGCDSFEEYSEDEEFYKNENNSMSDNRIMEEDETVAEDCETIDGFEENGEECEDEEFYNNENDGIISNLTEANYGNTTANSQIEYPLEVTATGHLRCVVCECKVPNHEKNRNEHINGWRHRHLINRASEHIEQDETVAEECETNDSFEEYSEECKDEELEDETVAEHCETNDSFEEYNEECNDEELEDEAVAEHCENNDSFDEYSEERDDEELEDEAVAEHCENNDSFEEYSEECDDEELEDEAVAEHCENNDSFAFEEYNEECEDDEFYNNENDGIVGYITEANGNTIANTQNEYPFDVTATGHIRCVVCECKVPNYENNRNEHINGWRHRHMINRASEHIEQDETVAEECETNDSFEEYSEECKDEELEDETVAEHCETNDSFEEYNEECNDEELEDEAVAEHCENNDSFDEYSEERDDEELEDEAVAEHCENNDSFEEYSEECDDEELEDEAVAEHCENNDSFAFEEYNEECEDDEFYNNENDGIVGYITEANGNTIANTQNEYPFDVTATGHIRCVVCECKVPNYENNRNEHINGWRHRHMVMNMNRPEESIEEEEENVENIEFDDSFEKYSDEEEFTDDNTGNSGNNNISDGYITLNSQIEYPYQVTVTGHVRCVICNCQVPSGVQNREEHINGMRHRTAALNLNQANDM